MWWHHTDTQHHRRIARSVASGRAGTHRLRTQATAFFVCPTRDGFAFKFLFSVYSRVASITECDDFRFAFSFLLYVQYCNISNNI